MYLNINKNICINIMIYIDEDINKNICIHKNKNISRLEHKYR